MIKTLALPRLRLVVGPIGVLGQRGLMMIATVPEDDWPLDADSRHTTPPSSSHARVTPT